MPVDKEKAAACFQTAAEQGFARAQEALGFCYANGEGVAKDFDQAVKWCRKAAEQGDAAAQRMLGFCYSTGHGVQQDYAEAARWYLKAAEQGDRWAQYNLGSLYYNGKGVQQYYHEAVTWFRKAAGQGLAEAQCYLGRCYANGEGVTKDVAEAVTWFRKAAQRGNPVAQSTLADMYRRGDGVAKDIAAAVDWYRKAAEQGNAYAQGQLGGLYQLGTGLPKNVSEAVKWTRRAADQGSAPAQHNLGAYYAHGEGVPLNDIEAYKWFSLAAAQGLERSAAARDSITKRMAREEVVEGQRRAAAFVARKEGTKTGSDGVAKVPETREGNLSTGTGFFVTDDGYLVTCEHVVRGATYFRVKLHGSSFTARLIKGDRTIDVALLKVEGAFQALPVAPESRVKLGDAVLTIGFPNPDIQGVQPKLTRGEVSGMDGAQDNPRYFQISVPVQPGNSGGALVDECGNVVGLVTSRLDDVATYEASGSLPQNVNYALKGTLVRDFLGNVPGLASKLKASTKVRDREAASAAAEHAAVLVIAE